MMHRALSELADAFLVPPHEVVGRIDAHYYRPRFVEAANRLAGIGHAGSASLATLAEKIGQPGDIREYVSSGVPVLNAKDVRPLSVNANPSTFVSASIATSKPKQVLRGDEVLVVRTGANCGDIAWSGPLQSGFLVNSHVIPVRPKRHVRGAYLAAYLASTLGQTLLHREITGAAQRQVSVASLNATLILVPDRGIQEYIGAKVELAERCRARALLERQRVAAAFEQLLAESQFGAREGLSRWVRGDEMLTRWLNAGYYRQVFSDLQTHLRNRSIRTVPLASVAQCNRGKSRPEGVVRYIEISDIDTEDGMISGGRECTPEETPKNAQRIVRADDILMSTRRPDRGAVACVTERDDGAFCSVFLARVQCQQEKILPRFLQEYLRRPSGKLFIAQRCTETTYPVISEDDIETIPIPLVPREVQARISAASRRAEVLRVLGASLVGEAKADVEAVIEGTLDVQAILAGTLKAPTAHDIPELAEDDA